MEQPASLSQCDQLAKLNDSVNSQNIAAPNSPHGSSSSIMQASNNNSSTQVVDPIEPIAPTSPDMQIENTHPMLTPGKTQTLPNPTFQSRIFTTFLQPDISAESKIIKSALSRPHWLTAMNEELATLKSSDTWMLVPRQPHKIIVGSRWVFKTKVKSDGKNQSTRVIYEVLQEEFTNDKWAWRKCGQKSIKGYPFPRNYFKCSTSRSCQAKKIIEKIPKNENYLCVSYSGQHNHDPPTYRRSLALYNNSSKNKLPKSINIVPKVLNLNASSSSSKHANRFKVDASSISQTATTLEIERKKRLMLSRRTKMMVKRRRTRMTIFSWGFKNFKKLLLPSYGNEMNKRN
ncbi:probable WRKY transcription factor 27 [Solanum tuberosum]|uniref:probable WRKY transcription factor 27 n=1 Tax=Solanum tuberosum TaxID=4113 RepID=UPI00073A1622|nr:PREDICTED: probable WRKY transcription factor 27 [Solanum tuberosum]